jgi:AcrR family transcriptional regulator
MAATQSSSPKEPTRARRSSRVRMTGAERREQLIAVSRQLFAARGYEGTSVEEIAARAEVSKPVVYEHFGGKEGLYAVVVDREVNTLLDGILSSLDAESLAVANPDHRQRELIERAALALLDYIIGRAVDGLVRQPVERHRLPGRGHPGGRVSQPGSRCQDGPDVCADACRDGRAHRSVVAGHPPPEEVRSGGTCGQSRLERAERPRGETAPADATLTVCRQSEPCHLRFVHVPVRQRAVDGPPRK